MQPDLVDYIYVENEQMKPLKRFARTELAESYDADKYAEMLLDVAEPILESSDSQGHN